MLGTKERDFASILHVSLEELVPHDHFYRHLERTLDLSFVREFVQDTYACGGRPSIDPIVFFKLQLVMFFEDIRSERLLMQHAADRLSVRWYLGYDLREPLPDHSSFAFLSKRTWRVSLAKLGRNQPRALSRRASHKKKPAVMLVSRRNDRLPCHWPPRSRRKRVRN